MEERTELAAARMADFAERTGLLPGTPPRRYLWTDAFALCNALELARLGAGALPVELARRLVEEVHAVLGRHRPDDARRGWLSGLSEAEGAAHPTSGGLRIGKPLPERGPTEPFDERLEWDRDGQYFHYLTKWMHALDQAARAWNAPRLNRWARELAAAAHAGFAHGPPGRRRLAWKMSVDLARPLVAAMGQHDPLDGLVTCAELELSAAALGTPSGPNLGPALRDFEAMLAGLELRTADPLGLGGLLADACRVAQLARHGAFLEGGLLAALLDASHQGLRVYVRQADARRPAEERLAFRELGLAIGLEGLPWLRAELDPGGPLASPTLDARLEELEPYARLGSEIVSFWLEPAHQATRTWAGHRDINDVMLATSLVPAGFLALSGLAPPTGPCTETAEAGLPGAARRSGSLS